MSILSGQRERSVAANVQIPAKIVVTIIGLRNAITGSFQINTALPENRLRSRNKPPEWMPGTGQKSIERRTVLGDFPSELDEILFVNFNFENAKNDLFYMSRQSLHIP